MKKEVERPDIPPPITHALFIFITFVIVDIFGGKMKNFILEMKVVI